MTNVDLTKFALSPKGIIMFVIGLIIVGLIIYGIWWGFGKVKESTGTETGDDI